MTSQSALARLVVDRASERREEQERVIVALVRDIVAERLGVERPSVTLDAALADDLGASSVGIMVLALAFEESFDIAIADDEVERLVKVRGAVRCVQRALGRRAALDSHTRLTNRQRQPRTLFGGGHATGDLSDGDGCSA